LKQGEVNLKEIRFTVKIAK